MANQTLSPFSQKTEIRKDASRTPGALGFFEGIEEIIGETSELVIGGRGDFVNEGPVRGNDLENLTQMPELKGGSAFPTKGELRGFNTPSAEAREQKLVAELAVAHNQVATQSAVESKRETINRLNRLQSAYKGSTDAEGNVTQYHQANAERQDAEDAKNTALKIQKEREAKLAAARGKAGGFKMGENELGKGAEDFGHFTRSTG